MLLFSMSCGPSEIAASHRIARSGPMVTQRSRTLRVGFGAEILILRLGYSPRSERVAVMSSATAD